MKLFAEIAWWSLLVTGCSHTVNYTLPTTEQLKVHIYAQGRPIQECEISPTSEQYKKLSIWLNQNRADWSATPATYVPGVLISGTKFSINFIGNSTIINYEAGQYSHATTPKDYEFVRCEKHA